MARTVFKYELDLSKLNEGAFPLELPAHAEVLSVGVQFGRLVLYARVEPTLRLVPRNVFLVGTGYEAPEMGQFVGTLLLQGGSLVVHVFVERELDEEEAQLA
jgi:hypothetical protein